jgi:hypothetical protein
MIENGIEDSGKFCPRIPELSLFKLHAKNFIQDGLFILFLILIDFEIISFDMVIDIFKSSEPPKLHLVSTDSCRLQLRYVSVHCV